jgi:hypothetical protein
MSVTTTISSETVQASRERLRAEHDVSLVPVAHEGSSFHKLPNGVYGFTYAPATETPLFQRHSYHSYEVHKTSSGGGYIICFVTSSDAELLRTSVERLNVTVYPDVYDDATVLVSIALDRVLNNNSKALRRDGNPVSLELAPAA